VSSVAVLEGFSLQAATMAVKPVGSRSRGSLLHFPTTLLRMHVRGSIFTTWFVFLGCAGGTPAGVQSGALLLGVEPTPGAPDAGATTMTAWVGGLDERGAFFVPSPSDIELTCDTGGPCTPSGPGRTTPSAAAGVLAIIIDDSGSNEATPDTCVGCPTDPHHKRILGVRELVRRVLGRAPDWRLSVYEFPGFPTDGTRAAIPVVGFTSYVDQFDGPLDGLSSGGSTYIFDSLYDVIPSAAGERHAFDGGAVPSRVLVLSDGEDTSSRTSLEEAVALALDAGVIIDTVGYGQRGDGGTVVLSSKGYRDLRLLATRTGGFCTVVSSDELPALFSRIGELYVAGYAERSFTIPGATGVIAGQVGLRGHTLFPFRTEDFR
jgi:hypothetical protein